MAACSTFQHLAIRLAWIAHHNTGKVSEALQQRRQLSPGTPLAPLPLCPALVKVRASVCRQAGGQLRAEQPRRADPPPLAPDRCCRARVCGQAAMLLSSLGRPLGLGGARGLPSSRAWQGGSRRYCRQQRQAEREVTAASSSGGGSQAPVRRAPPALPSSPARPACLRRTMCVAPHALARP